MIIEGNLLFTFIDIGLELFPYMQSNKTEKTQLSVIMSSRETPFLTNNVQTHNEKHKLKFPVRKEATCLSSPTPTNCLML